MPLFVDIQRVKEEKHDKRLVEFEDENENEAQNHPEGELLEEITDPASTALNTKLDKIKSGNSREASYSRHGRLRSRSRDSDRRRSRKYRSRSRHRSRTRSRHRTRSRSSSRYRSRRSRSRSRRYRSRSSSRYRYRRERRSRSRISDRLDILERKMDKMQSDINLLLMLSRKPKIQQIPQKTVIHPEVVHSPKIEIEPEQFTVIQDVPLPDGYEKPKFPLMTTDELRFLEQNLEDQQFFNFAVTDVVNTIIPPDHASNTAHMTYLVNHLLDLNLRSATVLKSSRQNRVVLRKECQNFLVFLKTCTIEIYRKQKRNFDLKEYEKSLVTVWSRSMQDYRRLHEHAFGVDVPMGGFNAENMNIDMSMQDDTIGEISN